MKKITFTLNILAFCITLSLIPSRNAKANEYQQNMLDEIIVYGEQNKSLTSTRQVTREDMNKIPVSNGNISDYLRPNPHVRYENSDQNGFQRGEILPENISINGADFNQTAYFVDNINVNNDLMIDSEVFDGAMQVVPGINHTQAYFFDSSMLSRVEVQDSNISASLGGFTGGAVIAKTKQYSGQDSVKLKYRTTQSSWAKMKADSNAQLILNQVRPDSSGVAALQPKYNKHQFSLMAEKEISDNLGLVIGFSRRQSSIEQNRLIGFAEEAQFVKQNHARSSDNFLLNLNWLANENNRFEFSGRYSNYHEKKYYAQNIDSNVNDHHKAYGATLAWIHAFGNGVWTNTFAYDRFEDKRRSSSANVEIVSVVDEYFDPLYDYEKGGYGDSDLRQQNVHFSTEYAFTPFDWLNTNHSVSIGAIYQSTQYQFNRYQDVHSSVIFKSEDGDFPLAESTTYKGKAKTNYQNIALYAEDLIKWRNLEFRPGLRIERDDYLKNHNIAPRFVAKYQPWQDTDFTLGLNRYYGRSFASLKLTDKILKINQDTSRNYQEFDKLKTPYTNELSFGLSQNWQNFAFQLGYIHRQNKNRIILKNENGNKIYRNGNPFLVNVYTLQVNNIEPWQLGESYWSTSLGFDWLDTKRADLNRDLNPNEPVYLDGSLMTRKAMVQQINSSSEDWIARIGIDMSLPKANLTWSNKVYVKAPVRGYEEIDSYDYDISRYRSLNYGKHVQWDSSIRWQPKISGNHSVYLQVDVLNVLNQTRKIRSIKPISTDSEYGIYTPGREFWLEVGYQF